MSLYPKTYCKDSRVDEILLDTHIFLWFISGDSRLAVNIQEIIQDTNYEIYLSVVSLWETIIKYQIGKLSLPESPEIYLPRQRDRHQITSLPIEESSVSRLMTLPPLHRDPFDRILICQALQHDLTIATVDKNIRSYPVRVL